MRLASKACEPSGAPLKPSFARSGVVRLQNLRFSDLLTVVALFLSISAFADTKANIPDWVRQAAAEKLPAYPPDTDAVVLLSEETDTITAPDDHVEHYRRVVRILRPGGRNEGNLSVWVGHDEKPLSIHGWSVDSAGHDYEVKDKDFVSHSNLSYMMYSDVYRKSAIAPAAGPGATVAFEYEIKRRDYFNELSWTPQEGIPVRRAVLTIQLPAGWELKDFWSGEGSAKSSPAGPNGWQWIKTDLPSIDDEPQRPAHAALAARLTIQLYTADRPLVVDWSSVSKRAFDFYRGQRSTSPELTAKVEELTRGKNEFDAKARAITEFIQQEFRYYAIELGIGGWQPHPASEVFRVRYGDCKDKANTLLTMLAVAGLNAEIVLISPERGVVRPELPSHLFGHAVIAVEIPAGVSGENYFSVITTKAGKRYVIFDPTDEWTAFGNIRSELQDTYALMVGENGGELVKVPIAPPSSNQIVRSARLKLTPEGALAGSVEEELTGDFAGETRYRAQSANQSQHQQHYEDQVARSLKNVSIQDLKFENLRELNRPVDVRFNFSADRYAQVMGPLLIVRPRVLGEKTIGLDRKPRKYPLVVGSTALEKDDFEVQIPAGYTVDDKPDPVSLDTPFASYKSSIEVNGDKLHYSREYVMKALEIPPDKIEALRAFENKVAADENAAVVFKKTADAAGRD